MAEKFVKIYTESDRQSWDELGELERENPRYYRKTHLLKAVVVKTIENENESGLASLTVATGRAESVMRIGVVENPTDNDKRMGIYFSDKS